MPPSYFSISLSTFLATIFCSAPWGAPLLSAASTKHSSHIIFAIRKISLTSMPRSSYFDCNVTLTDMNYMLCNFRWLNVFSYIYIKTLIIISIWWLHFIFIISLPLFTPHGTLHRHWYEDRDASRRITRDYIYDKSISIHYYYFRHNIMEYYIIAFTY